MKKVKYHYHNGVKVEDKARRSHEFLIQHVMGFTISPKGKLMFKVDQVIPDVGVEVTSITGKRYAVAGKGNLVRRHEEIQRNLR